MTLAMAEWSCNALMAIGNFKKGCFATHLEHVRVSIDVIQWV